MPSQELAIGCSPAEEAGAISSIPPRHTGEVIKRLDSGKALTAGSDGAPPPQPAGATPAAIREASSYKRCGTSAATRPAGDQKTRAQLRLRLRSGKRSAPRCESKSREQERNTRDFCLSALCSWLFRVFCTPTDAPDVPYA